jgi:hypothetical protein
LSLNDQDVITGAFLGSTAQGSNGNHFAIMISGGVVSTIAPPGAINTYTAVINDSGTIAGSYDTSEGIFGYILSTGGAFTSFTPPGGITPGSYNIGINSNGDVAGTAGPKGTASFGIAAWKCRGYIRITDLRIGRFP